MKAAFKIKCKKKLFTFIGDKEVIVDMYDDIRRVLRPGHTQKDLLVIASKYDVETIKEKTNLE